MGLYENQILPRCINIAMGGAELGRLRNRVTSGLAGDVLEIGFGSGRNVPYYPPGLTHVWAVDPATVGRKLAAKRVAASPVPIEYIGLDAQTLPLPDGSIDHVLSTWTLCTIPDVSAALTEVRRVLRRGGALHFIEHGRSPDAKMARRQDRLDPLNRRIFGGCHLNRPIDHLVADAGFELTKLSTYYHKRPSADGYTFEGIATKPAQDSGPAAPPVVRPYRRGPGEASVERRKREGRCPMRVLVTYGSTRGGTQELAEMVGTDLRAEGLTVDVVPPGKVRHINDYDAIIVGGALYASRWHRQSRRFVRRHTRELRQHPTYFFSSGPLDDSASHTAIQPVKGVQALMQRVNARDHTTFGGRLAPDAKGYPASVLAKKRAGDWRDPAQVRTWTHSIATQLSHDEDPGSVSA